MACRVGSGKEVENIKGRVGWDQNVFKLAWSDQVAGRVTQ